MQLSTSDADFFLSVAPCAACPRFVSRATAYAGIKNNARLYFNCLCRLCGDFPIWGGHGPDRRAIKRYYNMRMALLYKVKLSVKGTFDADFARI